MVDIHKFLEFKTVHRKGTKQCNADALSRMKELDPQVGKEGLDIGTLPDIADIHVV